MSAEKSPSHLLCPSCDAEPPSDSGATNCPACGTRLVAVRSHDDTLAGQVIDGRFEIRDRIGEGGMGTVYRAWQRSIGREVAIKLIDQRFVRDVMGVRRFLREARLASQLSQPSTVSVFDFGQSDDGRLFIAMELIRGRTLEDVLEAAGKFSIGRTARVGVQMCDALQAAHTLQIVHRDLKLANIMVLDDPPDRDLIKVLDFGLAKSLIDNETHRTQSGVVVGTPRYMAPEVAQGSAPAAAADLYSLGVILGELCTGKPLWQASNLAQLMSKKMSSTPVLDEVPAPLRAMIARLIDPDPSRRPASATVVRDTLLPLVDDKATSASRSTITAGDQPTVDLKAVAVPAPTSAPTTRRRWPLVLVLLAAILAGVAWIAIRPEPFDSRSGQAESKDAAPAAAAAPDAAAAPVAAADAAPAPDLVTLTISSEPGAAITIDGKPSGTTPEAVAIPRGTTPVEIVVELGGRKASRTVVPDQNRKVSIELPKKKKPTPRGGMPF